MKKNVYTTVSMPVGEMRVYGNGKMKLHAYHTGDPINDQVLVVEKDGVAVVVESPCFFDSCKALSDYLNGLGLKVAGVLTAYHMAGASFLPEVRKYATRNADEYGHTGGNVFPPGVKSQDPKEADAMERREQIEYLIGRLLEEIPQFKTQAAAFPSEYPARRRLLRSLMNLRPPLPLDTDFLRVQDELLAAEREERGAVDADSLPTVPGYPKLALWQGDITRLRADAIVNAANSALLGCFVPCHGCIDNAIHSAAGLQLREECRELMAAQGHEEPNGRAKLTGGYNLPAKYVLHTVGPVIRGQVTARDREELASCYRSCLELAEEHGLESIAFCCISTGEFHFPNREAAQIAVGTVTEALQDMKSVKRVIFNVFQDRDRKIYADLLGGGAAGGAALGL